jgi:hypothetical protein
MDDDAMNPESRLGEIASELGVQSRWMPTLEHAEKIREAVAFGMAYIEHRGHRMTPLLVFNDGGAMELPTIRWIETSRGGRLASVSDTHSSEQTTHYDVCGTSDTILEAVNRDGDLEPLLPFLDDIQAMIGRMHSRRAEYEQFVENVRSELDAPIRRKEVDSAYNWLDELRRKFRDGSTVQNAVTTDEDRDPRIAEIVDIVESVRDIAQYLEYSLADYRKIALRVSSHFNTVRGGRDWSLFEGSD